MASPRSPLAELGRLLASVAAPVYVVDARRRIIFANEALAAWTGAPVEQIVGRVCYFCADSDSPPREALAAALCPPPAVLDGARANVQLHVGTAAGASARWCQFVPLRGADGQFEAALALVDPWEADPVARGSFKTGIETVSAADPDSAVALHDWLAKFQAAQRRRYRLASLAGDSPALRRVRAQLELAAASRAHVLLLGPAGSGRGHAARVIFQQGRGDALEPTATLPCRSLSAELLRATWASLAASLVHAQPARATLMLLDLEQLPSEAQGELASRMAEAPASIRILATSSVGLEALAARAEYRPDVAAAVSTLVIELPALVDRLVDLPLLTQSLVEQANADGDKQLAGVAGEVLDRLALYTWPGNVGQLTEVVREAHRAAAGPLVQLRDLPRWIRLATEAQPQAASRSEPPIVLDDFLRRIERELIERALRQAKGNKSRAAKLLGTTRPRLYRRMVQVGLLTESPP
ncbi:MAG: helix-turn-helix domain-containing protein [Pirellulales bacterium]